ncbi:MAG: uracil phosphoribosyltransferase [Ilumatobacteraceae bacterium]
MSVDVTIVDHPIAHDSLSLIRDASTPTDIFRHQVDRVGLVLMAEATRHLPTEATKVRTPLADAPARRLEGVPVLVPILRAGLGLVGAAQQLLPGADVGFVGVARDETTHTPVAYVDKLADDLSGRPVLVLEPMLATGGSLMYVIDLLRSHGSDLPLTVVCLLAAPEGIERIDREADVDVRIVTAAVDDHLNDQAFIVPGLGDAGDRLFGRPG